MLWSQAWRFFPGCTQSAPTYVPVCTGFNAAKLAELGRLEGLQSPLYSLDMDGDGNTVVAGDCHAAVQLWDLRTRKRKEMFRNPDLEHGSLHGETACTFQTAIDPHGNWVASADVAGNLRIWTPGKAESRFVQGGKILQYLHADPLKGWLLAPNRENQATLFNPSTGQPIRTIRGKWGQPRAAAFSTTGRYLALSCEAGAGFEGRVEESDPFTEKGFLRRPQILLIDRNTWSVQWRHVREEPGVWNAYSSIAVHEKAELIAAAGSGRVLLWSWNDPKPLWVGKAREDEIRDLRFSPDGYYLASAHRTPSQTRGFLHLWKTTDGSLLLRLKAHPSSVERVRFTPDGRHMLTAGGDSTVKIWGEK